MAANEKVPTGAEQPHPRHPDCTGPDGYCPTPEHRVRDGHGFTCRAHLHLARRAPLSPAWMAALVALAQVCRQDRDADARLVAAAGRGIVALAEEAGEQGLFVLYGVRRYVRRLAGAHAALYPALPGARELTPAEHRLMVALTQLELDLFGSVRAVLCSRGASLRFPGQAGSSTGTTLAPRAGAR
jgi:hypothetical protein